MSGSSFSMTGGGPIAIIRDGNQLPDAASTNSMPPVLNAMIDCMMLMNVLQGMRAMPCSTFTVSPSNTQEGRPGRTACSAHLNPALAPATLHRVFLGHSITTHRGGRAMLDKLLTLAADPAAEADLRRLAAEQVQSLRSSAGCGDRGQVAQAEDAVRADPWAAFTFDGDGFATLSVGEYTWQAGRFELPSIAELRERATAAASGVPGSGARLWVLDGASPATDVGGLQAAAGERALFQVASQFNSLESPGPFITPVSKYFHDLTQGPRASVSAFPATLLRHYAAPEPHGKRFVQTTGGKQIDLLADVFGRGESPVCNGYLLGGKEATMVAALETGFERIRVGVHDGAQVVLGYNWDGEVEGPAARRITQVFTSTVAGGGYGGDWVLGGAFEPACRLLLRAAYLGTLLSAVALRRTPAVLTLIGGGVFGNPIRLIWGAILAAFDEVRSVAAGPLDVVLNGYNLSRLISIDEILPDVRARGGTVLRFDAEGLAGIYR